MSLTNPNTPVSQQDLKDFYDKIKPYMGLYPSAMGKKIGKGDMYSTEEKMIGQWIDGKPLYQKVIVITSDITSAFEVASDLETLVNVRAIRINPNAYALFPYLPDTTSNYNNFVISGYYERTNGKWYPQLGSSVTTSSDSYRWIFQYTKTTDSAISIGDETDYSTTEKIVGTWIDGSPVWQRVYTGITVNIAVNDWSLGIIDANMKPSTHFIVKMDVLSSSDNFTTDEGINMTYWGSTNDHSMMHKDCSESRGLHVQIHSAYSGTQNLVAVVQYVKKST